MILTCKIKVLGGNPVRRPLCATQILYGLTLGFETTNIRSASPTDLLTSTQISIKRLYSFSYQPALRYSKIKDARTETSEPDIA
jgi:hypothetical protein